LGTLFPGLQNVTSENYNAFRTAEKRSSSLRTSFSTAQSVPKASAPQQSPPTNDATRRRKKEGIREHVPSWKHVRQPVEKSAGQTAGRWKCWEIFKDWLERLETIGSPKSPLNPSRDLFFRRCPNVSDNNPTNIENIGSIANVGKIRSTDNFFI